jgi:hypothetical protein
LFITGLSNVPLHTGTLSVRRFWKKVKSHTTPKDFTTTDALTLVTLMKSDIIQC